MACRKTEVPRPVSIPRCGVDEFCAYKIWVFFLELQRDLAVRLEGPGSVVNRPIQLIELKTQENMSVTL